MTLVPSAPPPRPDVSLVVPAANEARRIPASIAQIRAYLAVQPYTAELIIVDDGSSDGTVAAVRRATRDFPPTIAVRVIRHARNLGKGAAVRSGCLAARGRFVVYMDADLAVPVDDMGKALAALESGCDLAIGSRIQPDGRDMRASQPFLRRLSGGAFTAVRRLIVAGDIVDTQCPLKAFRAEVVRPLFRAQRLRGWTFDAEILFLAERRGLHICQVPVTWRHQQGSRLHPTPRLAVRVLWDLIRIRLRWA